MDRLDVSEESNTTRDRAHCSVSKIAGNTPVVESSVTDCYSKIAHKPGAFQPEEGRMGILPGLGLCWVVMGKA